MPHSFAFCANEWEYRDTVEAPVRVGRIPLIAKCAMSGVPGYLLGQVRVL